MNGRDHENEARLNLHSIATAFSSRQQQYAEAVTATQAYAADYPPPTAHEHIDALVTREVERILTERLANGTLEITGPRITPPSLAEESVCVPKARLAELERIEKEHKDDRSHGTEINDLIHECSIKSAYAGMTHVEGMLAAIREQRARIAALESDSHTCPPGFRMVAVEEWEAMKREASAWEEGSAARVEFANRIAADINLALGRTLNAAESLSSRGALANALDAVRQVAGEADGAEELARECATLGWWAGLNITTIIKDATEAVQWLRNTYNAANGDREVPGGAERFRAEIFSLARERLAARASAKVEPAPTTVRVRYETHEGKVTYEDVPVAPAPDSGAFKSALERVYQWMDENMRGATRQQGVAYIDTLIREVRRERAERPADADAPK